MSSDSAVGRYRTWRISHVLHASLLPALSSGLRRCPNVDPHHLVKHQFDNLCYNKKKTPCVIYIHLRVLKVSFDACVSAGRAGAPLPDLAFQGYIQADWTIGLSPLKQWLDATWIPVRGKLLSDPMYKTQFIESPAAFVFFSVLGVPALGPGGRPSKAKTPAVTFRATSIWCLLHNSW